MIFVMLVTLYTSRIVLATLGVSDYGIYNVVGGIVAMFSFLNTAMSATTQRYITYNLGIGEVDTLKGVFSTAVLIHMIIAILVILLAETIGLWFLKTQMSIPADRATAAFWVYQCSILSTVFVINSIPYNAEIIAHEDMSFFAYVSIAEVILQLLSVYLLLIIRGDKLITYAVLILCVKFLVRIVYGLYAKKHYEEVTYRIKFNRNLFKEMSSFAGWSLFGTTATIFYTEGLNILLNIFFGPLVNAARGLAVQVQRAVSQFSSGFQTAINPQITKYYAAGDIGDMHQLIFRGSKYTFFLLFAISFPLFLETPFLLNVWLTTIPEYTVIFIRLMLCTVILDAVANPIITSVSATGKVKFYQIVIGSTLLLIVPISYVALKLGALPYFVYIIHLFICLIVFFLRLFIVCPMIKMKICDYVKNVIFKCVSLLLVSAPIPITCELVLPISNLKSIIVILLSIIVVTASGYFIILGNKERSIVKEHIFIIFKGKSHDKFN